jgi:hypothetical protein
LLAHDLGSLGLVDQAGLEQLFLQGIAHTWTATGLAGLQMAIVTRRRGAGLISAMGRAGSPLHVAFVVEPQGPFPIGAG